MVSEEPRIYQALVLPEQALDKGGVEILRAGIVEDDLYVSVLPAFKAPAQWGEVLADIARRVGAIYAANTAGLSQKDATVQIAEAFVSDLGAVPVPTARPSRKAARKAVKKTTRKITTTVARKKR